MTADTTIIDKVAWLHIQNHQLLVVRSKNKVAYFTPGGKRETGETDLACLTRELHEELCITFFPETAKYMGEYQAPAYGKPAGIEVRMKCYSGSFHGTFTAASEVEEIGWFTSKDIDTALTTPVDKIILADLKEKGLID